MAFRDRVDAGRELALRLTHLATSDPVVVGLPRGGVPVAAEVAHHLQAPLDVIVVRKLGVPWQPELAMGAVGEGGVVVMNESVVRHAGVGPQQFAAVQEREQTELDRRVTWLRAGRPPTSLAGRVVIIVDDGVATGATARAACQVARASGAARVVLAAPVLAADVLPSLEEVADEVVFVMAPPDFSAVGEWYDDFAAVRDDDVVALLRPHVVDVTDGEADHAPHRRWIR